MLGRVLVACAPRADPVFQPVSCSPSGSLAVGEVTRTFWRSAADAPKQPPSTLPVGAPHLSAAAIAQVPGARSGRTWAMRAEGGLALWASTQAGARTWFARPLSARGEANGQTVSLGEAPRELGLVSVPPASRRLCAAQHAQDERRRGRRALGVSQAGRASRGTHVARSALRARCSG